MLSLSLVKHVYAGLESGMGERGHSGGLSLKNEFQSVKNGHFHLLSNQRIQHYCLRITYIHNGIRQRDLLIYKLCAFKWHLLQNL